MNATRLLIDFGANVEALTPLNRTPLHLAAAQGHAEVVEYLLTVKANAAARTPEGETARDLARKYSYLDVERMLAQAGHP